MPIPLDTCGPQGCFAEMQISPDLLSALKAGKRLSITYQNSAKNNVVVPLVLDNFGESFQKIQ
jgi:invasion protein IalB